MDTVSCRSCHVHTCRLSSMGLDVRKNEEADDCMFPNVVFTAPPSGSEDYAAEVCPACTTPSDNQTTQVFQCLCHTFLKNAMYATGKFSNSLMSVGMVHWQRTISAAATPSTPLGQCSSMLTARPDMHIDMIALSRKSMHFPALVIPMHAATTGVCVHD